MAGGADPFRQEALNPLHALVVFDLRERVFHRVNRVVISKIHLGALLCFRIDIDDVLFLSRTVVDDFFFCIRQILKRNVGPHAHLAAHILHQRPHECAPDRHGTFINGQILIGHERTLVHCLCEAGSAADSAGAAGVKRQILGAGSVEMLAADRADDLLHRRHGKRRRRVMSVRTAVARKS